MARTELPNGVILPAEYSDDWYEDMTSNLTKLDDVIGSDSEKLNSNDVAFLRMSSAALTDGGTGNFSDLNSSNKLKTGDYVLDSGRKLYQVVSVDSTNETFTVGNSLFKITAESDLAPVAESGDYDDLTDLPTYGITRFCSSALTDNSSVAFSAISNTDKIKVGDFLLDTNGKLFEITAVDTTNQTVTVGSALIDLALDANVVHTSGNETISGDKVFNNRLIKNIDVVLGTAPSTGKFSNIDIADNNKSSLLQVLAGVYDTGNSYARFFVQNKTADDGTGLSPTGTLRACGFNINLPASSTSEGQGSITPTANKTTDFGLLSYQWRNLWCEKLFLNGTQLDPSAFALDNAVVHLSGTETISGTKTFARNVSIYNSDTSVDTGYLILRNQKVKRGSTTETGNQFITFHDKDSGTLVSYETTVLGSGNTQAYINVSNVDANSQRVIGGVKIIKTPTETWFTPDGDNTVSSGLSNYKWKDVQTKLINGLTPSSLSMPSITGTVDISGYVTDLTGGNNQYTAPENGWISVTVIGTSIAIVSSSWSDSRLRPSSGNVRMLYPVLKNETLTISIVATTLAYARFFPCQGNI